MAASRASTQPRRDSGCTFAMVARASCASCSSLTWGWGPSSFAGSPGGGAGCLARAPARAKGSPSSKTARSSSSVASGGRSGTAWPSAGRARFRVSRTMPVGTGMREVRMTSSLVKVAASSHSCSSGQRPKTSLYCAGPALRAAASRIRGIACDAAWQAFAPAAAQRLAAAMRPEMSPLFSLMFSSITAFFSPGDCVEAAADPAPPPCPHFDFFVHFDFFAHLLAALAHLLLLGAAATAAWAWASAWD
mmetsp:Transcript_124265/g.362802  ORF Transcript_124265/g.362802 Transcript_124265/m.362802 type:complete len:248 (-) Transcript_124265:41-784(-)